jgi:hypothetical protein
VAITAQRLGASFSQSDLSRSITVSDNAANERILNTLSPDYRSKIAATIAAGGASVDVLSSTGHSNWSITSQAVFAAHVADLEGASPVFSLMGLITGSQRWGLGKIGGSHFKGGWGPVGGGYLVRQFGVVPINGGCSGIAIGVQAPGFSKGQAALNQLAAIIQANASEIPAGGCPAGM